MRLWVATLPKTRRAILKTRFISAFTYVFVPRNCMMKNIVVSLSSMCLLVLLVRHFVSRVFP